MGLAHHVVLQLLEDDRLCNKVYIVVMDNYYSSPTLFKDLLAKNFGALGTVRRDRKGLPLILRETRLQKGDIVSSMDDSILALKWRDKRDVYMLSTYHGSDMLKKTRHSCHAEGGVEDIMKPHVVYL